MDPAQPDSDPSGRPQVSFHPVQCSVQEGTPLEFCVGFSALEGMERVSWSIMRIDPDCDSFCLGACDPLIADGAQHRFCCKASANLKVGLYSLTNATFLGAEGDSAKPEIALGHKQIGACLVEVRHATAPPRDSLALLKNLYDIINARLAELCAGFGRTPGEPGCRDYRVLVFVRDFRLTRPMRLGGYEAGPADEIAETNGEMRFIRQFLAEHGLPPLPPDADTQVAAKIGGTPVAAFHFPRVIADSAESAVRMVSEEVEVAIGVLSISAHGPGFIFGVVVLDEKSQHIWHFHATSTCLGQVVLWSCVDDRTTKLWIEAVKAAPRLQFYIDLYRGAAKESRTDLAYLRYWSLFEAIAESKNYVGQVRRLWDGVAMTDSGGRKVTIKSKQHIVFEHLRRTIPAMGWASHWPGAGNERVHISELVMVWYQRRNCVAHSGGCFAADPARPCNCKSEYAQCRDSLDSESKARGLRHFRDGYFFPLQDIAGLLLTMEINQARGKACPSAARQ